MAIIKPTITIDGNFSDWVSSERIDYGDVTGYSLYSEAQNGFLYFDLNAPTGVAIGPTTTIWLNTDLNAATGYQIFGFAGGAEYNVEINADGTASLYQDSAGQTAPTLVLSNISIAYSADKTQVELAIPLTSIGNPSNPLDVLYRHQQQHFRSHQLYQPTLRGAQRRRDAHADPQGRHRLFGHHRRQLLQGPGRCRGRAFDRL